MHSLSKTRKEADLTMTSRLVTPNAVFQQCLLYLPKTNRIYDVVEADARKSIDLRLVFRLFSIKLK